MALSARGAVVRVGHLFRVFAESYGALTVMSGRAIVGLRRAPWYMNEIVNQFDYIGRRSLPLIVVTGVFMGFVLGIQIGQQTGSTTPSWIEGGVIIRAVLLAMGPLVTGLVLAGRVGSGVAAELGSMAITEQVDALRIMGIDPVEFLVTPRLVAGVIAVPVLIIVFDFIGVLCGYVSAHYTIGLSWPGFIRGMRRAFVLTDLYSNLIKAFLTGAVIVIIACHFGLRTRVGANGVGRATTSSVIWSSIAVTVIDYVLSALLFYVW